MNIIDFVRHRTLLDDREISPAQIVVLKAIYGIPLTGEKEQEIFRTIAGTDRAPDREAGEATIIAGRRSGKSSKIAASIALYEGTMREHRLSPGEIGTIQIVSAEMSRQAKICFSYVLGKLKGSPILRKMIEKVTADSIDLRNRVRIQAFPCDAGRIRGQSVICLIGDEVAFWKSEGVSIDKEVLEAARPGLSFPYSKMIKISTPYAMKGEIYSDWKRFFGKPNPDCLVLVGSTEIFNPSFSRKKLEAAKRRDPVAYATEYEAAFRTDIAGMYDPGTIDRAVGRDRPMELSSRKSFAYSAFVDVAGGGGKDSFALAIGHIEGDRIIIDSVRSRKPKFNPQEVTAQYSDLLRTYGIDSITGDKYSGDWASNAFVEKSIIYKRAEKPKSDLYLEMESILNTDRIELPPRDSLIRELKSLVRRTRSGGRDSVDTDGGIPEDEANVVAGLSFILAQSLRKAGEIFGMVAHDTRPDGSETGDPYEDDGRIFRDHFKRMILNPRQRR